MTRRSARWVASAAAVTAIGLLATSCSSSDGEASITATSAPSAPPTPASTTSTTAPATTAISTETTTTDPISPGPDLAAPPARLDTVFDTAQFAERLSSSHATMVDTTAMPDERERAGIDHQLVLRELADRTELDEEVLAALDPAARPAVERVVRARQFLQARTASRPPQPPPDELPAWTIVEPEPIEALLAHYAEAEQLTGVGWYWLAAIHLQETRMGRIQGVSSADAVGPMQFLPETWARCCSGDPTVTRDAIIGAATYLAQSGAPADMAAALYEYNPNEGYVAVVTAYAESLREEPELYTGYHAFQVFFGSSAGTVRLPVGYSHAAPIDAVEYLESNPQDAA
jgi:membrane-bound lytic murein transglycosylase B